MSEPSLNILLVQAQGPTRQRFLGYTGGLTSFGVEIFAANTYREAIEAVFKQPVDVIILDLAIPDSSALEAISNLTLQAPHCPLIALDTQDIVNQAEEVMMAGAQDWIQLSTLNPEILTRSVRYSMERHQLREALKGMALIDAASGLYNKTGFDLMAQQQIAMAQRQKKPFLIFHAEITNLEEIREKLGVHERSNASLVFARAFAQNFRRTDIVGRYSPEIYVALAMEAKSDTGDLIVERLVQRVKKQREEAGWPFKLSLTLGCAPDSTPPPMGTPKGSTDFSHLLSKARAITSSYTEI
jgi:two-component system cell cycle response regulator